MCVSIKRDSKFCHNGEFRAAMVQRGIRWISVAGCVRFFRSEVTPVVYSLASVSLSFHCSVWLQLVARGGRCVTATGVLHMFVKCTNLVDFRLVCNDCSVEKVDHPVFSISPLVIHHELNLNTTSDALAVSILLSSMKVTALRLGRTTFTPRSPLTRGSPCYHQQLLASVWL